MKLPRLEDYTSARVSLGRAGNSLPTRELLNLQLAHAKARQAVDSQLDTRRLALELRLCGRETLETRSAAPDRATYLRRPDLGRRLSDDSHRLLLGRKGSFDAVFIIVDGLSAMAVQLHAARMMEACLASLETVEWKLAPAVIVQQGRVAIGDEIGTCIGAALSVVFIGERPGLSAADSLGIYLTWNPRANLTDADRNCISNIRADGLSYSLAAHKLAFLMREARRRKLSGVELKEDAKLLE